MTHWFRQQIIKICLPILLMYFRDWDTTPWLKTQQQCGHGFFKRLRSPEFEAEIANATTANVTTINAVCTALNSKDQLLSIKMPVPRTSQKPMDQVANHLSR
jgi:hypothetical protein